MFWILYFGWDIARLYAYSSIEFLKLNFEYDLDK